MRKESKVVEYNLFNEEEISVKDPVMSDIVSPKSFERAPLQRQIEVQLFLKVTKVGKPTSLNIKVLDSPDMKNTGTTEFFCIMNPPFDNIQIKGSDIEPDCSVNECFHGNLILGQFSIVVQGEGCNSKNYFVVSAHALFAERGRK
jgi:hypothetical protein